MASNTGTSIQSNQTFTTGVVPIAVGVLNPVNTPQFNWDCGVGCNYAVMTTVVTGSPVSFTILLEGTYDGNTWFQIGTTSNVAGETTYSSGGLPFTNLRARCTAVSGGTNPAVNVFATASQTPLLATTGGTTPTTTALTGLQNAITTLNAATTGVNGATADCGAARRAMLFEVIVTGAPTGGTITFQASADGVNWVTLTGAAVYAGTAGMLTNGVLNANATTLCLISPNGATGSGFALRYIRANSTTLTGGVSPTVTVLVSAY